MDSTSSSRELCPSEAIKKQNIFSTDNAAYFFSTVTTYLLSICNRFVFNYRRPTPW